MRNKTKNKRPLLNYFLITTISIFFVIFGLFIVRNDILAGSDDINTVYKTGRVDVSMPAVEPNTDYKIYGFSFKYASPAVSSIMMLADGLSADSISYCLENGLNEDISTNLHSFCHPTDWYPIPTENGFVATYRGEDEFFEIKYDETTIINNIYIKGDVEHLPTNIDVDIEYVDNEYNLHNTHRQLHKYSDPQDPPQQITPLIYENMDTANDMVSLKWPEISDATSYKIYYTNDETKALTVQTTPRTSLNDWTSIEITDSDYQDAPSSTGYLNYNLQIADIQQQYVVIKAVEDNTEALEASNVGFMYGDVNRDGYIDSSDALNVARTFVGIMTLNEIQVLGANVSGDDYIDTSDALLILQYFVGLNIHFSL